MGTLTDFQKNRLTPKTMSEDMSTNVDLRGRVRYVQFLGSAHPTLKSAYKLLSDMPEFQTGVCSNREANTEQNDFHTPNYFFSPS